MDAIRIGAAIKSLRLQAAYTQHDLAKCLNVTDKAVSKWERGLSIPDISIIIKLSKLLNCDVDNLLEGNITYLEEAWQGFLVLPDISPLYSGSSAYGKPLVYFFLSYFLLVGIRDIEISCSERDKHFIETNLGDGSRFGAKLSFLLEESFVPSSGKNTMVVFDNPFLYGPNLTRYFQRAMSRHYGISVLTIENNKADNGIKVSFDHNKAVKTHNSCTGSYAPVPVVFFPALFSEQIGHFRDLPSLSPLYAEPLGNGMIEYPVTDENSLLDTSNFLRFISDTMGKNLYDPYEIARSRNLL